MRRSSGRPSPQPPESPWFASSNANSHSPFRLFQSRRTSCGRGYSGRGTPAAGTVLFWFVDSMAEFNTQKEVDGKRPFKVYFKDRFSTPPFAETRGPPSKTAG